MEDFFGEGCYDKAKAYTPINENKAKLAAYCVNDKNFTTPLPCATGCGP